MTNVIYKKFKLRVFIVPLKHISLLKELLIRVIYDNTGEEILCERKM